MAEASEEPLVIKIVYDWSEADESMARREAQYSGKSFTFSTEGGFRMGGGGPPREAFLPPPSPYADEPFRASRGATMLITGPTSLAALPAPTAYAGNLLPGRFMVNTGYFPSPEDEGGPTYLPNTGRAAPHYRRRIVPYGDRYTRDWTGGPGPRGWYSPGMGYGPQEGVDEPYGATYRSSYRQFQLPSPGMAGSEDAEFYPSAGSGPNALMRAPWYNPGMPHTVGGRAGWTYGGGFGATPYGPNYGGFGTTPPAGGGGGGPAASPGTSPNWFGGRLGQALNANILPGRMMMNLLFGAWDVSQVYRGTQEAYADALLATNQQELIAARIQGVEAGNRGILGNIAGLGMDLVGAGPTAARNELKNAAAINTDLLYHFETQAAVQGGAAGRAAFRTGGAAAARLAVARAQMEAQNRALIEERTVIRQQLGETREFGYDMFGRRSTFEEGGAIWHGFHTSTRREYALQDPAVRASRGQRLQDINERIQNAQDQQAFDERLNRQQTENSQQQLRWGAAVAHAGSTNVNVQHFLNIAAQQDAERRRVQLENPALLPDLIRQQGAQTEEDVAAWSRENYARDLTTWWGSRANNFIVQRMPFQSRLAGIRGGFAARRARAQNDPLETTRINAEETSSVNAAWAEELFEAQESTAEYTTETTAMGQARKGMPLEAIRTRVRGARDRALARIGNDPSRQAERDAANDYYTEQENTQVTGFNRQTFDINRQLQYQQSGLRDIIERAPTAAKAWDIYAKGDEEVRQLRRQGRNDEASLASQNTGLQLQILSKTMLDRLNTQEVNLQGTAFGQTDSRQEDEVRAVQRIRELMERIAQNELGGAGD